MPRTACEPFDFDEWARLAERDPAAFEARREQAIEELIQRAPSARRERLRRLQWRVDRTREGAPNPVAACVRISRMMWDSLLGDGGLLETLEDARDGKLHRRRPPARVLAFQRRQPPADRCG